ncbi:MAG: carboxypeptidase regulatory-like domain-containing protein, partial [Terriglobia bacterium]
MRHRSFRAIDFLLFLILFLVLAPFNFAQTQRSTSGLRGSVTDTTGAVVPGAKVQLRSESEGYVRTASTNGVGAFVFLDLTPGVYDLTVQASGFKEASVHGITLYVGQTVVQDFRLQVGAVTQTVSVKGTAPLLNQTNGTVGTIIESRTITELPLNGRNFLQLPLLSPGASFDKNSNTMDAVNINPTAHSFNMEGARGDYNLFTLDGTVITEWQHGSNTFSPSVDAVQEFQAAGSNYSAASGVEAAAQVNLVTKSGTNQFHGDVYEFLRNNALNARNFFSPGIDPFHRNQFGGTLGGPLLLPKVYNGRNKSFFFVSYEGYRQSEGFPLLGNYPTPAQLGGDLSTLVTPGKPLMNPATGLPFAGNVIPSADIPAHLETFLQNGIGNGPWLPAPNSTTPGFNFFRTDDQLFRNDQVMV